MSTITILTETALADELGVTRAILKNLREKHAADLPPGEAWRKDGTVIVWTLEGRAALLRLLELEKIAPMPPALPQTPDYVHLVVTRVVRNPRIVLAERKEGPPGEVRLRVRDSANFRPGMVCEKCRPTGTPDLFNLEGRTPRFRGRW